MLANLIDLSPAPLRSVPRDIKQWAVTASASWAIALDNVSAVPGWLSDTLCKAVTGDGYVDRVLYCDEDVTVLAFRRVTLMTSIAYADSRPAIIASLLDLMVLVLAELPGLSMDRMPRMAEPNWRMAGHRHRTASCRRHARSPAEGVTQGRDPCERSPQAPHGCLLACHKRRCLRVQPSQRSPALRPALGPHADHARHREPATPTAYRPSRSRS